MTSRWLRTSLIAACAWALAGNTALAQDEPVPDDFGDDAGGEVAPPPAEVAPAAPGPQPGALSAGAKIMLPKGLDDGGDIAIGGWVEVTPWATYQVDEKLSVGLTMPLMLASPDFGDAFEVDALQAIVVDGKYRLGEQLHGKAMLGYGVKARLALNPWGGGFAIPGGGGDSALGFGAGGGYVHKLDRIKLAASAALIVQLDSGVDDSGDEKPLIVAHVPLTAMYEVDPRLSVGIATGLYTGDDLAFDSEEGFTFPFVAGGRYQLNPNLAAGGFLGLGSIAPRDGLDVGDTLTLGAFAAWSQ